MPFNGSGTFTRTQNWTNDANNNLPISATKFDNEDNDFAGGLSLCLTRDGQGKPSSPLIWLQPISLLPAADGAALVAGRSGGTNNPALSIQVADASGITLSLNTAQQLALATNATSRITISGTGNVAVVTPSSGIPLMVSGLTGNSTLSLASSGAATTIVMGWNVGVTANAWNIFSQSTDPLTIGTNGNTVLTLGTNGAQRLTIGGTGNVSINAASSGITCTINGTSGTSIVSLSSTVAASTLQAGFGDGITSSAWNIFSQSTDPLTVGTVGAALLTLATNSVSRITIDSSGNISGRGPVGGSLVDMTPDTGSWTTTLSGPYTSNPTGTLIWRRMGNMVTVYATAAILGTTTSGTNVSASGLPAAITPTAQRQVMCLVSQSSVTFNALATVNTGGTITLQVGNGTATFQTWASGNTNSGLPAGFSITYAL